MEAFPEREFSFLRDFGGYKCPCGQEVLNTACFFSDLFISVQMGYYVLHFCMNCVPSYVLYSTDTPRPPNYLVYVIVTRIQNGK